MNRLREMPSLHAKPRWHLAAAYSLAGQPEAARKILKDISNEVEDYRELSYNFGSQLRDRAIILETYVAAGDRTAAAQMVEVIADQISASRWYSTQDIAYALMALGKYIGDSDVSSKLAFTYKLGNQAPVDAGASQPIIRIDVPIDGSSSQSFTINNTSQSVLYARFYSTGQPVVGDQTAAANNLKLEVSYKTLDGKLLDPSSIPQGTDFIAEAIITHPGPRSITYKEMALTQVFPSGWEIMNTRMDNLQRFKDVNKPTYIDIRDDRACSYFNIPYKNKHTYRIQLNAAYQGRFYLPSTSCEAMYDNEISARQPGMWVEVTKPEAL